MGKDMLQHFVEDGYLDASVTEGFDPYYEPSWFAEDGWRDDDAWTACEELGVGTSDRVAGCGF